MALTYPYTREFRFVEQGYNSGTTYREDACVSISGQKYLSLQNNNVGHDPASNPSWWLDTGAVDNTEPAGVEHNGIWNPYANYQPGYTTWYSVDSYWYTCHTYAPAGTLPTNASYFTQGSYYENDYGNREIGITGLFDAAPEWNQWLYGGGGSNVGVAWIRADCTNDHWAAQEVDSPSPSSSPLPYSLGPTVRMIDGLNFYKATMQMSDEEENFNGIYYLYRVRAGIHTLIWQSDPQWHTEQDNWSDIKLGVHNDANGNPVLEIAYRYAYMAFEEDGAYTYLGSYTDTSPDAIIVGGKPGTWGFYPLTEGTSHFRYGNSDQSPTPIIRTVSGEVKFANASGSVASLSAAYSRYITAAVNSANAVGSINKLDASYSRYIQAQIQAAKATGIINPLVADYFRTMQAMTYLKGRGDVTYPLYIKTQ